MGTSQAADSRAGHIEEKEKHSNGRLSSYFYGGLIAWLG